MVSLTTRRAKVVGLAGLMTERVCSIGINEDSTIKLDLLQG